MNSAKPPSVALFQLINAYWMTFPIIAAAELGLADLVAEGPQSPATLAERTSSDPPSLYRLLRALASLGIFSEGADGRFSPTPLSELLRADVPGSLRGLARLTGRLHLRAWPELLHSIQTGETGTKKHFGAELFEYLRHDPDMARTFKEAFVDYTDAVSRAIAANYDFSRFRRLVDVGGGVGTLLAAILVDIPDASGICLDLPQLAERANAYFATTGLADRCQALSGDFLQSVPASGDLYILKMILHTWDDHNALAILGNVRRSIASRGTLLVMDDAILPARNLPSISKLLDLNMLVVTGGRKRTEAEYRALLNAAGFALDRILPAHPSCTILESHAI